MLCAAKIYYLVCLIEVAISKLSFYKPLLSLDVIIYLVHTDCI